MTTYIGITGTKGVGKTTLAAMLKDELPGSEVIAFADELRADVEEMLQEYHGTGQADREWLEARKATVFGPLLQGYGEYCRQRFGDDYWIAALRVAVCNGDHDTVIVPDVRHVNEAEWIKAQGGLIVAIVGPSRWPADQRDPAHPSEANVRRCQEMADMTVINQFSLDFLRSRAKDIANRVSLREAVS